MVLSGYDLNQLIAVVGSGESRQRKGIVFIVWLRNISYSDGLNAQLSMAVPCSSSSSVRFLQLELKKLQEEPVEGFRVRLVDDSNLFVWEVAIFGPPDTLYEGGYYKVLVFSDFMCPLFVTSVFLCLK